MRLPILSVVLCLSVSVSGCGTVRSKLAEESQVGHPYSGVSYDALAAKCLWKQTTENGTSYRSGVDIAAFASVYLVIDGAFSLLADTAFLPIDFAVTPRHERVTADKMCGESLSP